MRYPCPRHCSRVLSCDVSLQDSLFHDVPPFFTIFHHWPDKVGAMFLESVTKKHAQDTRPEALQKMAKNANCNRLALGLWVDCTYVASSFCIRVCLTWDIL